MGEPSKEDESRSHNYVNFQLDTLYVCLFIHVVQGPLLHNLLLFRLRRGILQCRLLQLLVECYSLLIVLVNRVSFSILLYCTHHLRCSDQITIYLRISLFYLLNKNSIHESTLYLSLIPFPRHSSRPHRHTMSLFELSQISKSMIDLLRSYHIASALSPAPRTRLSVLLKSASRLLIARVTSIAPHHRSLTSNKVYSSQLERQQ